MELYIFSVQAPSLTKNETLKIGTVVQQIMKELNGVVSEDKTVWPLQKMVLNFMNQNGS
jgi:hypothetical protein